MTRGAQEIIDIISKKSKEATVTKHQILILSKPELRRIALIWNWLIVENLHEFEYYSVSQLDIAILLSILSKKSGRYITKRDFVKMYSEDLVGTKGFAEKCFKALTGDESHLVTREKIITNFLEAVSKYIVKIKEEPHRFKPEDEYRDVAKPLEGERDVDLLDILIEKIKEADRIRTDKMNAEIESYWKLLQMKRRNTVLDTSLETSAVKETIENVNTKESHTRESLRNEL